MEHRSRGDEWEPVWARALPSLWDTLLLHFKRIFLGTLLAMTVAVGVALLLPKTFRASSTLAILPPHYVELLEIPPISLSMPSVLAVATSDSVLQDVLTDLTIKRSLVQRIHERDPLLAEGISAMSATTAAEILNVPNSEAFRLSWEGMPPTELIAGFEDFRDSEMDRLDTTEMSGMFKATIGTSLETNLTTQYQPVFTLSTEWRTSRSAALLSYLWSRATLRALERDIVGEAIALQTDRVRQVVRAREVHRKARSAPYEFLAYHPIDLWASEVRSYEIIRAAGNLEPADEERLSELRIRVDHAESELESLRKEWEKSEREFAYSLDGLGGVEALVEDYATVLRANLLGPPSPPIQKIRPRRSAIVLAAGAVAFLLLLASAQMREIRRMG